MSGGGFYGWICYVLTCYGLTRYVLARIQHVTRNDPNPQRAII